MQVTYFVVEIFNFPSCTGTTNFDKYKKISFKVFALILMCEKLKCAYFCSPHNIYTYIYIFSVQDL